MNAKERKITAYHEGGHALVAASLHHTDPVTKVTILPRGRALGYTMVMPSDDKYSTTRNEMLDQLAYALGGRVAEEIVFHDPTTGAANDIEKATGDGPQDGHRVRHDRADRRDQARRRASGEVFLGRDMGHQRDYSEEVAGVVDEEVRKLIETAHDEAWRGPQRQPRRPRRAGPRAAREGDARHQDELATIFDGRPQAADASAVAVSESRLLSDLPPVLTPAERDAMRGGTNGSNGATTATATARTGPTARTAPTATRRRTPAVTRSWSRSTRPLEAGASPLADEEPRTQVIEVPDGGRVDPSEDY